MMDEAEQIPMTAEHFEAFKRACEKYRALFGLADWKLYYGQNAAEDCFADSILNSQDAIATLRLCKRWDTTYRALTDEEIDRNARHEMIHVLLGSLTGAANSRWVASEGHLDRIVERTVHLIEHALDAVAGGSG